jgi:hypothetical protein
MKPPIRLRDDPQAPPELRADLQRSANAAPEYDVAAGLIGLHAAIGAPLPPVPSSEAGGGAAAASGSAASSTTAAGAKLGVLSGLSAGAIKAALVGVIATGAAAVLAAVWLDGSSKPVPPDASRSDVAPVAADGRPARRLDDSPHAAPALQPAPREADAPSRYLAPVAPGVGEDPAQAALRDEIAQLGRIKALVDDDPERAYQLARTGQREFAPGILRHEREALAVRALWNMGSRQEAQREARRFLARYPQSPLRPRIEQLLAEER